VAGYFQSLLNRPLTGPQVLRPPRRLFAPRPSQELERDEAPDEGGEPANSTHPSPGRAARVWSGNGSPAIFVGDSAGEPLPISMVPDHSDGVGEAIDRDASANADSGPWASTSEPAASQSSPVRIGHRRVDRPDQPDPVRRRTLTAGRVTTPRFTTPEDETHRAPSPVAARRSSPPRERNDVFRGPAELPDAEGTQPSLDQASQSDRPEVRQGRAPRKKSFEEPVSVEIGRVDVIISPPEARQAGPRPPLHPLSRGLGWAAGPPESQR